MVCAQKQSLYIPLKISTDRDLFFFFFFCLFFALSWAAPSAYGGAQARGLIGAVAAGLHQGHSNVGSEPSVQPIPQFTATLDL